LTEPTEAEIQAYVERAERSLRGRAILPFVMLLVSVGLFIGACLLRVLWPTGLIITGLMLAATYAGASAEHHYASALGLRVSPFRVLVLGALGFVELERWKRSFAVRLLAVAIFPLLVGWLVHLAWPSFWSGTH
jgi:hypothetical protein